MAKQDLEFPHYELASEIDICELGLRYDKFHLEHFSVLKAGAKMIFDISYPSQLPDPIEDQAYLWAPQET